MPSNDGASRPKRSALAAQRSSSATQLPQSLSSEATLSTSAQKQKPQRRVGHGRIGPRIPSYSKNVNKLAKLSIANVAVEAPPRSPRPGHVKRNSSHLQITVDDSHTGLKKNHSETSLRKNRSSGQLMKLTRPASSRNVQKLGKGDHKAKRSSAELMKEHHELQHPTVRFDLGDDEGQDDGWTEDGSNSQSPATTRSNSMRNSMVLDSGLRKENMDRAAFENIRRQPQPPDSHPSDSSGSPDSQDSMTNGEVETRRSKPPDPSTITSRLLNRNMSFTKPRITDVSAIVSPIGSHPHEIGGMHEPEITEHTGSQVSRFIDGGGSSGTPRESNFLPRHEPRDGDTPARDKMRNKSAPDVTRMEAPSKTASSVSSVALAAMHPSRTQQKLWLERASTNIEQQQQMRPMGFGRSGRSRVSSAGAHFHTGSDGAMNAAVQQQQLHETALGYRVMRRYQNPLADSIARLQEAGVRPATSRMPAKRGGKQSLLNGGDGQHGLSQSLRHSRAGKGSGGGGEQLRKSKVMFEGVKGSRDDVDVLQAGKSLPLDGGDEVARELCRTIWDRPAVNTEGGD